MYTTKYPPFAVVVDIALFTIRDSRLSVLLIERARDPDAGSWALPGGFVDPDEDAESAAWRELVEETGVERFPGHLEQLKTYTAPDRDPRMRTVSVAHVAFAPDLPEPKAGDDAADARWWPVDGLPDLAFDHAEILADALERVRAKLEYTTLAIDFVTEPFTLPELRQVYAAVWGTPPDLRSFQRMVLGTDGFVVPVPGEGPTHYRRGPATEIRPPLYRD